MATLSSLEHSYALWKRHVSNTREDTELSVAELLRDSHPQHHVTRTSTSKVDLVGFAEAGHATATPRRESGFDASRVYKAPSSRLDREPGKLEDNVRFGSWEYKWEGRDFIIYTIEYRDVYMRNFKHTFALAPRTGDDLVNSHGPHPDTDALLMIAGAWTKELHEEIYVYDDTRWNKSKELWKSVASSTWDDIVLDPAMKSTLVSDVESFFDNEELYHQLSVPWKRGVIFHGVPGNGKTLSVKALINSLSKRKEPVPSLYVKSFDGAPCVNPKYSINEIFKHARAMAPCLLVFEDIDSLVEERTRSYFLNEVDGIDSNEGILMIGSTNHLDRLDPAIAKRPSRFDRKYHFKVPGEAERVAYGEYWAAKLRGSGIVEFPDELCPLIAKMTEGFSFAYMKELFVSSLLAIARGASADEVDEEAKSDSGGSSVEDAVVVEKPVAAEKEDKEEAEMSEIARAAAAIAKAAADPIISPGVPPVKGVQAKVKRTVPELDVPESFRDNSVFRIFRTQTKVLLEQMDNTEGEKKKSAACGTMPMFDPSWFKTGDD